MCYFSYSPNGYVAALYQAFVLEPLIKEETNTFSENEVLPPFPLQDNTPENVSEEGIAQFISSYIFFHPLTAGQRHSTSSNLPAKPAADTIPRKAYYANLLYFSSTRIFVPKN